MSKSGPALKETGTGRVQLSSNQGIKGTEILCLEAMPTSSTTTEELARARARTPSCRRTSPTSDCGRRKERMYVSVLGARKLGVVYGRPAARSLGRCPRPRGQSPSFTGDGASAERQAKHVSSFLLPFVPPFAFVDT